MMIKIRLMALTVTALLCAVTLAMAQTSDLSKPAPTAGTVTNSSQAVMPMPAQTRAAAPGSMSPQDQQRTAVPPTATNAENAPKPGSPGATGYPSAPK